MTDCKEKYVPPKPKPRGVETRITGTLRKPVYSVADHPHFNVRRGNSTSGNSVTTMSKAEVVERDNDIDKLIAETRAGGWIKKFQAAKMGSYKITENTDYSGAIEQGIQTFNVDEANKSKKRKPRNINYAM